MLNGKTVFVSGGAGVIGRALVAKLIDAGAIVYVGDLKPKPSEFPPSVKYRQGDLNYLTKTELDIINPEYFFHLAATFERSTETYEFWEENFQHNILLSHHLMTLFKSLAKLKRVVFASSYLIYDKNNYLFSNPPTGPTTLKETDPIAPRNLTGAAKLLHEVELNFLQSFDHLSFSSVSARIYRSYGKHSRDVISRWVRSLLKKDELTVFRMEGLFDYIYADDVAEGLIQLAKTQATGIVNLGTGRSRRVTEVIEVLRKHFSDLKLHETESAIPFEASQADMTLFRELTGWQPKNMIEDVIPQLINHEKTNPFESVDFKKNVVLVTSASKKIPLLREVRKAIKKIGCGKIIAADANKNALAQFFSDDFWLMPKLSQLSPSALVAYCKSNNVSKIIPTRDGELLFFSKMKKQLASEGIDVMVADEEAVNVCLDKLLFAQTLEKLNLPMIPTCLKLSQLEATRFVVKERFGAGSIGIAIDANASEAEIFSSKLQNPIFQPFISGNEYSVDIYVNKARKAKGAVTRSRDLIVNGESQVTTTVDLPEVTRICIEVAEKFGLVGHSVFQVIVDKNKQIHMIECNPRFGGASSLSIAAGLDTFYWSLLESAGTNIDEYPFTPAKAGLRQIRFAEDLIQYESAPGSK